MSTPPALRALGLGEILDLAIKIYRTHFTTLLKLVLVVVVPTQIISSLITVSSAPEETYSLTGEELPSGSLNEASEIAPFVTGQILVNLLALVAFALTTAACFKAVGDAYLGNRPDWRESLRFTLRRLGSLTWLIFLTGLLLLPAFLALVIPAIWLGVAWLVATPVLMFEGIKGRHALRRSFRLVRGRWWPTFGTFLVATILVSIVSGIFGFLIGLPFGFFLADDVSPLLTLVLLTLLNIASTALTTPFLAAIVALIYFDLRIRKEGLDLELVARGMGGESGEGGAPMAPTAVPEGQWGAPGAWQPAAPVPAGYPMPPAPSPSPSPPPAAGEWAPPAQSDLPPPPPGWAPPEPPAGDRERPGGAPPPPPTTE